MPPETLRGVGKAAAVPAHAPGLLASAAARTRRRCRREVVGFGVVDIRISVFPNGRVVSPDAAHRDAAGGRGGASSYRVSGMPGSRIVNTPGCLPEMSCMHLRAV